MGQLKQKKTRARTSSAKGERAALILEKASRLSLKTPNWSMADLAATADLAKGTLYLYFKTKEEVELAIFESLFETWAQSFLLRIQVRKNLNFSELVEALLLSFKETPELGHYSSRLHPILEQNLSLERTKSFKRSMKMKLENLAQEMGLRVSTWDQATALRFLILAYAQLNGLWPMANPSITVAKALEDPELALFKIDLLEELSTSLLALANGLHQTQNKTFHFLGSY